MASGGYSQCFCCQWRYATSNAQDKIGGPIVAKYCKQCKGGHVWSPQGRELIYSDIKSIILRDPSPGLRQYSYGIFGQQYPTVKYFQCWCCEYNYKQSAVVRLNYECGIPEHSITVCIRCAWQHQTCPYKDSENITQDSQIKFLQKVENSSEYEPYE